jgi:hypothetical protein
MVLLISGRRFSRRTPPVDLAEHMRCLLRSSRIKVGPKSAENAVAKLLDETHFTRHSVVRTGRGAVADYTSADFGGSRWPRPCADDRAVAVVNGDGSA